MKKIVILLISVLFVSGCYNYRELNELAIGSGLGLEFKDNEYHAYLQVININNFSTQTGSDKSNFNIYEAKGKTIFEAIRNINTTLSKEIFLSHMKIVVLDDSLFSDLEGVIDFLMNELEISLNVPIVATTTHNPKDILSIMPFNEEINGSEISNLVEINSVKKGLALSVTAKDFFTNYFDKGISNTLSVISIEDEKNDENSSEELNKSSEFTKININELITFNKDKQLLLNENHSLILNLIKNNIENNVISFSCGDKYFSVEVVKSKFNMDKFKNNKLHINGDFSVLMANYSCDYDLNETKSLNKIKKIITKNLNDKITETFNYSKEQEVDFLGVGKFIKKSNKGYYQKYKHDWDKLGLKDINVDVDINVNLVKQGNLKGDIHG